jgi:hypothetical protein
MSVERIKRLRIGQALPGAVAPAALPHPGLARAWAGAQPDATGAAGTSQHQVTGQQPFGHQPFPLPLPPSMSHSHAPQSPTGTSAAAAALAQQRFGSLPPRQPAPPPPPPQHAQQQQQQQQHPHQPQQQQQQHAPYETHHFQNSPPLPPAHHQMWSGAGAGGHGMLGAPATSTAQVGSAAYGQMNTLLAQLHSERVRAGARAAWVEEPDDDEEEDW